MCFEGSEYSNGQWDGLCIEATNVGTPAGGQCVYNNHWQSHFKKYDAASLDGVNYNIATWGYSGYNVVQKANSYAGAYSVSTTFTNNSYWYCSKLVSRAFWDLYGYSLGWSADSLLITPEDIWYDPLIVQRAYSTSAGYDGYGVWSSRSSANLKSSDTTLSQSSLTDSKNLSTFTYNGVIVESAESLDEKAINNAKKRIDAEIAEGKKPSKITIENTKPGLNEYLKKSISSGKLTEQDVQEKWNVNVADLN